MNSEDKKMFENQIKSNYIQKLLILIVIPIIIICACLIVSPVKAATLQPQDTQYLEMRAVEIKEVEEEGKQLIFELWAHDIDFKGFDVRFAYDSSNYQPSNITTNEPTDDETEYFAFETEFQGNLEMFTLPYAGTTDAIRAVVSFDPPVEDSAHIQDETVISSGTDVLLGKMSFKMLTDTFDLTGFYLIEDTNSSPKTGIKINIDVTDCYEAQSTFRFTDKTASKDATLKNIIISTGIEDPDDPDNSTYKKYDLTPIFDKDTKEYTLEIKEYIDKMNIKAEQTDPNSTMKIKVPKRDENGDLVYESDGKTIVYEEKDLLNNEETEFILNELGEEDTIIEIIVTAQDGKTSETYKVTIHRPYGTIKGRVEYGNALKSSFEGTYEITVNTNATIKAYNTGDFNWEGILSAELTYEELDLIEIQRETKTDGSTGEYELKLIPGQYDIFIEELGFLTATVTNITLNENDIINVGLDELYAGDTDRNGMVDLNDMVDESYKNDTIDGDGDYEEKYDFSKKGYVSLDDLVLVYGNQDRLMSIREYK